MCIVSIGLMQFLDFVVLMHLDNWTLKFFGQFLIYDWTSLDKNLVRWFPLLIGILMLIKKPKDSTTIFKSIMMSLAFIFFSIIIGIIVALYTWTNEGAESPLLPEYIRYQPFQNYWTMFVLSGLIISILFYLKKSKKIENNLIDN